MKRVRRIPFVCRTVKKNMAEAAEVILCRSVCQSSEAAMEETDWQSRQWGQ